MKRLLLVQPFQHEGMLAFGQTIDIPFLGRQAGIAPLSLATLAALTPQGYQIDVWDETVAGEISEETPLPNYDLVGVTGYVNHLVRATRLGSLFKQRGMLVVAGGPGVSSAPEKYRDAFDVLFVGEAEHKWPEFLADWEAGRYRPEYRQVTKPDLAGSPLPKWDAIDLSRYLVGAVQTTRGCPFDCSYCDVIYLYGRQARHKTVDSVLAEVVELQRRSVRSIFVCDDNFYGNPKFAKDLLRQLIPMNNSFKTPVRFITQITLNVAQDDDLLALMADANFPRLFIGIETPNKDSLKEVNKPQNYRLDLVESVRKIQSYGLSIEAGIMVGFDHDGPSIFDEQADFIKETGLSLVLPSILQAPVGTPLWRKLYKEGRILEAAPEQFSGPGQRTYTNMIPRCMSRADLYRGFADFMGRLYEWKHFAARTMTYVSTVTRRPRVHRRLALSPRDLKLYLGGVCFFVFGLRGDARRQSWRILLHTMCRAPYLLEVVISNIFQFHHERGLLEAHQAALRTQIDREKQQELRVAAGNMLIPEAFRKSYKEIFPEVYERLSNGLLNGSRLNDALVEVFGDFLVRWGPSLTRLEESHRAFLLEICARTIAKENAQSAGLISPMRQAPAVARDLRIARLPEEILRSVEQDLRVGGRARAVEALGA
ncbi:MAG: DUF4070 domain-containing protein [Acidobacteria bacterium]|nr:DUF4070 domain-containing protein [Acidobacteriota bacterium]